MQHSVLWAQSGHLTTSVNELTLCGQWEQLRALTAGDAYAQSHAYCARAQLQAVTYHKDKGEVGRVKVAA